MLEDVVPSRRDIPPKRPKSQGDERQVDSAQDHQQPRQQKHVTDRRVPRIWRKHEWRQDQELDGEWQNGPAEEGSNEPVPVEQVSSTTAIRTQAKIASDPHAFGLPGTNQHVELFVPFRRCSQLLHHLHHGLLIHRRFLRRLLFLRESRADNQRTAATNALE